MAIFSKCCADCGASFTSIKPRAEFCGDKCRKTYNNRRAVRGAELYDVAMCWKDARTRYGDEEKAMILLLNKWKDEDAARAAETSNPAFQSYTPWKRLHHAFKLWLSTEKLQSTRAGK